MWSTKISGGAHPGQAETSQVLRNVAWNTLYFAINLSRLIWNPEKCQEYEGTNIV